MPSLIYFSVIQKVLIYIRISAYLGTYSSSLSSDSDSDSDSGWNSHKRHWVDEVLKVGMGTAPLLPTATLRTLLRTVPWTAIF